MTTAHPSITVKAGVASAATSVLSVSRDTIASGAVVVLRLQAKDAAGNALTSGGEVVVFSRSGGTSTGVIGATADSGNGVYTATFTGVVAGTATTIGATINGAAVSTLAPTIAVKPGAIAGATSVVTASTDTLLSGAVATLRLRAKDAAGNLLTTGGDTVVFTASGGSSSGSIGAAADSGNGVYTATFTGLAAGTATTIHASANGSVVTTGLPLMTVLPGAASRLAFTVQPSPAFLGAAIAPAVEVTARDAFGNTTPAFTGSVGVAIGTNPGTGTLTGTLSHNAVAGVASFNDLKIDQPGIGYTLTASAGGLAGATSASFDVITAAGTIAWANAAGGNWSNPANWNGGVVPGPTDIALITLPGTYTVTFDVSDSIGGLQLGGSSGTQTLIVSSKTLGLAAGSQINANGVVSMASATLNGPGSITNAGQLFVQGTTALNGAIATAATSMIRVQGNGSFSTGNVTVASGFTNNGTIILTDTTSSYGAVLHVTSGTLTNASGAVIDVRVGANGTRTLDAQLNNQGTLTVGHPFSLTKASAVQANSGTINVNAKLVIQQSGAAPSFTNSGAIAIGSTDTLAVTGGTFAYSGGTINVGAKFTILQTGTAPSFTNSGSMSITSGDTVAVSGGTFAYAAGAITGPGALAFNATTVNLTQDLNTAAVPFSLTTATVSGTGTLTVAPSTTLQIRSSTINSRLVNQGALDVHGTTAINDSLTNGSGATLRLQGDGSSGTSNLTVANNFTNSGAIVLTDTTSSYGAVLNMPAGARLTNAPGGTIDAAVGTAGPRTLGVEIDNQGTITLNRPLSISRAGAAHTNSGTINVSGGDLTLSQSGVTPSFTTSGTITIGAGRTFTVTSGAFNYGAGTINGSGTLAITSAAVTATQDFSTATTGLTLTNATWGGAGKLTVAAGTSLRVRASTINTRLVNQGAMDVHGTSAFNDSVTNASGATLRLQGDGGSGTSNLTVLSGFTNSGTLVLTDTTSSYGAVLNVTNGTLTNAAGATLRTDTGTVGPRTLNGQLDNEGTLAVLRALTISKASAAHVNRGTIDVHDKLTIAQSGTSPSFTQLGAVTMGAGDTIAVTSGSFVYDSGTINGGTLGARFQHCHDRARAHECDVGRDRHVDRRGEHGAASLGKQHQRAVRQSRVRQHRRHQRLQRHGLERRRRHTARAGERIQRHRDADRGHGIHEQRHDRAHRFDILVRSGPERDRRHARQRRGRDDPGRHRHRRAAHAQRAAR